MAKRLGTIRISALALLIACTVFGSAFMSCADLVRAENENGTAQEELLSVPSSGMGALLYEYCSSSEDLAAEYLATTAVASSLSVNEYVSSDGDILGKYIVCAADEYAYIYESADESSDVLAKIYTNSVATLLELGWQWCYVISDGIEGYVKTADFYFGEVAQDQNDNTYKTLAYTIDDELYMYESESTQSAVVCVLYSGYGYEVCEEDDGSGYTKICVEGAGEGYVKTESISEEYDHSFAVALDYDEAYLQAAAEGVSQAQEIEAEKAAAQAAAEEAAEKAAEEAAAEKAAEEAAAKAAQEAAAKAAAQAEAVKQAQANADALAGSGDVASLRQAVVDYALTFVGWLPYVAGGKSLTTGVDCSGFTSAIYAHFGYSLSSSSSAQAKQGRSVSLSEITIGDIVVYSGHVAIYIGNGQIVHAPRTGEKVKVADINIMTVLDVRRIIE